MASQFLFSIFVLCHFTLLCQSSLLPEEAHSLSPRAIGDLCEVQMQRTAIAGNRLWFMSGEYLFESSVPSSNPQSTNRLYYIDLTTSFSVSQSIPTTVLQSVEVPDDLTPRISAEASSIGGEFWYDNTTIYLYSGISASTNADGGNLTADNILAAYNTSKNSWETVTVGGGNFDFGNRISASYASDPQSGLSFHLGGEFDIETPGLVEFNASNPSHPTWVNQTSGGTAGTPVPDVLEGSMVFLPYGDEGILIQLGGYNTSGVKDVFWPNIPLSRVSLYDVASSTWFTVEASGTVPPNISAFCLGVSSSPDQSAFQINLYGGWDLEATVSYEDVYVLSVPSFQWIKINDVQNNTEAQLAPVIGRKNHRCVMWKDSQMIVVGGFVTQKGVTVNNETTSCGTYPPIRVLDVSTFTFQSQFDPNAAAYTVPNVVYQVIGGNGNGGATMKTPPGGFNDSKLDTIFSKVRPPISSPSSSSSSSAQNGTSPTSSSHSDAGAIAGGVVGGVAALAIIAAALFWFLRRRRGRGGEYNAASSYAPTSYAPSELPPKDNKYMSSELPSEAVDQASNKGHYSPIPSSQSPDPVKHTMRPMSELPAEAVELPELGTRS